MISINTPQPATSRWGIPCGPFSLLSLALLVFGLPGWALYTLELKGFEGIMLFIIGVPICCGVALLSALVGCVQKEAGSGWAALLAVAVPVVGAMVMSS